MESGLVSPNIHFDKPLQVEPLLKGRIVVPSEVFRFPGVSGQIGLNSDLITPELFVLYGQF